MLFVRLDVKWDTVALNQKVIELYSQKFRSGRDLKDQLNPP